MKTFDDEKIITQSDDGTVTLTSHRINQEVKSFSKSTSKSIMLEHITSCETIHKQSWLLIIMAVIGILGAGYGVADNNEDLTIPAAVIGLVCLIAFWLTRRAFIKVASPSTVMHINVKGMPRERITEFVDQIEHTKHSRLSTMNTGH